MAITPLWKAGAEFGNLKEFTYANANFSVSATSAKTGTYSFRIGGSSIVNKNNAIISLGSVSQFRFGCHISPSGRENGTPSYLRWFKEGSATAVIDIRSDASTGVIEIAINGTVQDSMIPTLNTWQHWGVDAKIATSGWVSFYVDGVEMLSFVGDMGASNITSLQVGPSANFTIFYDWTYLDDLYIDTTVGEAAPLPPPDKRFLLAVPSSDTTANWTPSTGASNYALVDEIPTSATDFVSTTASGTIDTYGVAVPPLPTGFSIAAAWPTAMAWKANAAADSSLTLRIADGVTDDDGSALHVPSTQGTITERFALQPDGSAWNNADFAAWSYGIVSSGTFT